LDANLSAAWQRLAEVGCIGDGSDAEESCRSAFVTLGPCLPSRDGGHATLREAFRAAAAAWLPFEHCKQLVPLQDTGYEGLVAAAVARLAQVCAPLVTELLELRGESRRRTPWLDDESVAAEPAQWLKLFGEFPVLAHVTGLALDQWRATSTEMLSRVAEDLPALEHAFFDDEPAGPLVEIALGAGDRHNGGRAVALLRFEPGRGLVYKPRDLDLEVLVRDVFEALNLTGLDPPLATFRIQRGDGYGYEERVEATPMAASESAGRFYRQVGAAACVLQLLGTRDMIADNLVAAGATAQFVDVECALSPTLASPPLLTEGRDRLYQRQESTVLSTSVLLAAVHPSELCPTRDLGCLSHADEASYEDGRRLPLGSFRPFGTSGPADPWDHAADVEQGYRAAHEALNMAQDRIVALVESAAATGSLRPRFIFRSTFDYHVAIAQSLRPSCLSTPSGRMEWLRNFVYSSIAQSDAPQHQLDVAGLCDAEVGAMLDLDIPRFATDSAGLALYCPDGTVLDEQLAESGLAAFRRRVGSLRDVDSEVAFVRAAIDAARGGAADPPPRTHRSAVAIADPLEAAQEIGELLLAARGAPLGTGDGWLGVRVEPVDGVADVVPARADLVGGALGPALFLAELGNATDERRYASVAVETIHELLDASRADPSLLLDGSRTGSLASAALQGATALVDVGDQVARLCGETTLSAALDEARDIVLALAMEAAERRDATSSAPLHESVLRWGLQRPDAVALASVLSAGLPVLIEGLADRRADVRTGALALLVPSGSSAIVLALAATLDVASFLVDDADRLLAKLLRLTPSANDRGSRLGRLVAFRRGVAAMPVDPPSGWERGLPVSQLLLRGEEWQCRSWALDDPSSAVEGIRFVDELLSRRARTGRFLAGRVANDAHCLSAVDGIVAAGRLCLRASVPSLAPAGVEW